LFACVLAIAFLVSYAGGTARADVLVLDACTKQCDPEDLRVIGLTRHVLQDELKRPGLVASVQDVIDHLGGNVPLPSVTDPDLTAAGLTEHLKAGIGNWAGGQHQEAVQLLETALAEAVENPATVVSDPTLRQLIPRAYVGRAVSLMRLNRVKEAKEAIAELVRTTPEPSILDSWGTEADKIFQLARKELVARGTGSLTIQVDDPTAIFYLDEAGQPHKTMFAADVLPGLYRVFVLDTMGRSRRYVVEVVPHGHATLDIDWRRDTKFEVTISSKRRVERYRDIEFEATMSPTQSLRVGFTFASFAERRLEGDYARRIAALAHSDFIAVIGRIHWKGKPAVIGVIYQVSTSTAVRVGIVPIAGNLDSERALANSLFAPELPAPNVISLAAPPWETPPPDPADDSRADPGYLLGWMLGIGTIASGTTLIALSDDEHQASRVGGFVVGGLGIGLVAVTTFYYRRRSRSSPPMLAIVPTTSGVFVSVGSSF
jgi:hypothetical protein